MDDGGVFGGGCYAAQQSVQGDLVELEHEHEAVDGEEVVLLLNTSLLLPVLQRARAQPAFRQRVTGVLVARGEGDDAPASFSPLSTFPQVRMGVCAYVCVCVCAAPVCCSCVRCGRFSRERMVSVSTATQLPSFASVCLCPVLSLAGGAV